MIRRFLSSLRGAGVAQFQLATQGQEFEARETLPLAAVTPYRVLAQHMTPMQVELMTAPKTELK